MLIIGLFYRSVATLIFKRVVLGRPKGIKSGKVKLSGKEDNIRNLREQGVAITEIAKINKRNRNIVSAFICDRMETTDEEKTILQAEQTLGL